MASVRSMANCATGTLWALRHDIAEFSKEVEMMTATGKCKGISCCDCPITLVQEMYGAPSCVEITPEEKKKLLAMELSDE